MTQARGARRSLGRLTIGVLLMTAGTALAQDVPEDPHVAQPERPTVATHAGTVAPGWLEIETGVERDRYADATRGGSAPLLFKVGLAPRLQLSVQDVAVWTPGGGAFGPGDLFIGAKWRVLEDAPVLGDFALLPSVKLPTGSAAQGLGTGTTDVGLLLISSRTIRGVAIDLNAGYTYRTGTTDGVPRRSAVWTASFGGSAAGPVGWCAELFGFPSIGADGGESSVAFLGGPTFTLRPSLVLDAGFIAPLSGPQPRAIYAGMTWNIGRLWRP
jgi:Putative MetA-pathway of phenol degradation